MGRHPGSHRAEPLPDHARRLLGRAWNAGTVKQILSNATYSGTHTRTCVECGGSHDITVPALADMATERRAADALKSRVRGSDRAVVLRPVTEPEVEQRPLPDYDTLFGLTSGAAR